MFHCLIGCNTHSPFNSIVQMWKNNTNFLDSGPYIDLPAYHPIRLFNIFIGGLYIVVVPFVYFRIFRWGTKNWDLSFENIFEISEHNICMNIFCFKRSGHDICKTSAWVLPWALPWSREGKNTTWWDFVKCWWILMKSQFTKYFSVLSNGTEVVLHINIYQLCQIP